MYIKPSIYERAALLLCVSGCSLIILTPEWRSLVAESYTDDVTPEETIKQQEKVAEKRLKELREFDDFDLPRWGVFASVSLGEKERETRIETGYDAKLHGVTVGTDYRLDTDLIVGATISNFKEESDLYDDAGKTDIDSTSLSVFTGYSPTDNSHLDLLLGYTRSEYDKTRNSTANSIESTHTGHSYQASLNAGYQYNSGALSYGPILKLSYSKTINDDTTQKEEGQPSITIKGNDSSKFKTSLGASVRRATSFEWGVLSPFASVFYENEKSYNNNSSNESDDNSDEPDENTYSGRVGFSAAMPNNFNFFVSYEQLFAHDYLQKRMTTVGVRLEF